MARTVLKYSLEMIDAEQRVETRGGAIVRYVGMQRGRLCVWVECDHDGPDGVLLFRIFGTGHKIDDDAHGRKWVWCGTTQDGEFVWHVYAKN